MGWWLDGPEGFCWEQVKDRRHDRVTEECSFRLQIVQLVQVFDSFVHLGEFLIYVCPGKLDGTDWLPQETDRANWMEPIGCPRKRTPSVISAECGSVGDRNVSALSSPSRFRMESCGLVPVVEVRIFVFLWFMMIPNGLPSLLKRLRNQWRSVWGRHTEVSSIMDAVCALPPIPSSAGSPWRNRCVARRACSLLILVVSARRTKHENRGLKGQPWGNPASWRRYCACLHSSKYHEWHG